MSEHGETIISRLTDNSKLKKSDNPSNKLINNSIGEWLDNYDVYAFIENCFIDSATGKWLDLHGKTFNIYRKIDESDEEYRKRIVLESLGRLTVDYLVEVYDLNLYVNIDDFDIHSNQLTSDNTYIVDNGFMAIVSEDIKNILVKKFVIGGELTWLTL